MPTTGQPDLAGLERAARAALGAADTERFQAVLTTIMLINPRRAQALVDEARVSLALAAELRTVDDPRVVQSVTNGDARMLAMIAAYRETKRVAGSGEALIDLWETIVCEVDYSKFVDMVVAAIARAAADPEDKK